MENIQSGIIFKILSTRPLQSQLITICVKKPVLQAFFWRKSSFSAISTSLESYGFSFLTV